ncbi:hypothetical protein BDQ17DRAFT_1429572 [Cyathus striatus]|nr:hypothetical protein BDQ17DRAFT_1429572 [Cyathus striatus]
MIFRATGGNNYCTEILHLILNLKYIWTPEFANVMCDSHVINLSGHSGHWMAMDLNMEHTVSQVKELIGAKGLETTWDMLGNVSASINEINKIKKKIAEFTELSHRNRYHSNATQAI